MSLSHILSVGYYTVPWRKNQGVRLEEEEIAVMGLCVLPTCPFPY